MIVEFIDLARQKAAMADRLQTAIGRVLDEMAFVNGREVHVIEARLADRLGGGHVVACANGTDALQIMLRAAEIGPGDGVALPSLTFVATAEAVQLVGATPIFVDTDPESGTLCPESLKRAVMASRRGELAPLRAVLPVDLFSLPADHGAIG